VGGGVGISVCSVMKAVAVEEEVDLEFLKGGMWPKMRTFSLLFFLSSNHNNGSCKGCLDRL
jgi:hypothetical protein